MKIRVAVHHLELVWGEKTFVLSYEVLAPVDRELDLQRHVVRDALQADQDAGDLGVSCK